MSTRRLCSRSMYASEASKSPEPRARAPAWCKVSPSRVCCSPVILIHTVAGLKCEMARAARGDQGLLPVVRLELRTLMCGALRAAAAQTSAVACWWDTPWEPLPGLADWARQCAVWVVGSGPGDVGPSTRGHDLSQGRFVALPELKRVTNVHLSGESCFPGQCA